MANSAGNSAETPSPDIINLGNGVFPIDTRMAWASTTWPRRSGQRALSRYARYAPGADPSVNEKFDRISGADANVGGIWHWLDRLEHPAR